MIRTGLTILVLYGIFAGGRMLEEPQLLHRLGFLLPQLVSVVCMGLVARRFEWGDAPLRPWLLLAAGAAVLVGSRLAGWAGYTGGLDEGLLIVSNLLNVAGVAMCLRVVQSSPLVMPMSQRLRTAVLAANALASTVAVVALWVVVQRLVHVGMDEVISWTRVAAVVLLLCDAVVFVLAVTLSATAWPLSGGLAARPYLLIAGSGATFLVLDLVGMLIVDGWGYGGFGVVLGQVSLVAWALFAAAGLAQVHVLRVAQE